MAAMMSQLGCVTLHPETIEAVYAGRPLPPDEQKRFDAHPGVARDLLSKIPRMEPIAWMIAHQNDSRAGRWRRHRESATADMRLGANMLRATLAFDELVSKGLSPDARPQAACRGSTRISIRESFRLWWSSMARKTRRRYAPAISMS